MVDPIYEFLAYKAAVHLWNQNVSELFQKLAQDRHSHFRHSVEQNVIIVIWNLQGQKFTGRFPNVHWDIDLIKRISFVVSKIYDLTYWTAFISCWIVYSI